MAEAIELEFDITTTAQVERTYRVKGTDGDQAHQRLRSFIKDADAIRPGLVVEDSKKRTDTTPQRVKTVSPVKDTRTPPTTEK